MTNEGNESTGLVPALRWAAVIALLLVGAYLVIRPALRSGTGGALGEEVTIRFTDTGDTITMQRGRFERMMLEKGVEGPIDPSKGIINPKTNAPTGFPADRAYWEGLVASVNEAMSKPSSN